ncbi:hypothetical protein C7M84_021805 [Penaeus vannamei]|uniref:Uncharacterized protein n=1 Tax=Penaeus vannamei TaxID=6689 RepID=A0A3R7SGU0_PENVA|nr:hypothetical protein C7M84_021805 [Penaeus vannamei]
MCVLRVQESNRLSRRFYFIFRSHVPLSSLTPLSLSAQPPSISRPSLLSASRPSHLLSYPAKSPDEPPQLLCYSCFSLPLMCPSFLLSHTKDFTYFPVLFLLLFPKSSSISFIPPLPLFPSPMSPLFFPPLPLPLPPTVPSPSLPLLPLPSSRENLNPSLFSSFIPPFQRRPPSLRISLHPSPLPSVPTLSLLSWNFLLFFLLLPLLFPSPPHLPPDLPFPCPRFPGSPFLPHVSPDSLSSPLFPPELPFPPNLPSFLPSLTHLFRLPHASTDPPFPPQHFHRSPFPPHLPQILRYTPNLPQNPPFPPHLPPHDLPSLPTFPQKPPFLPTFSARPPFLPSLPPDHCPFPSPTFPPSPPTPTSSLSSPPPFTPPTSLSLPHPLPKILPPPRHLSRRRSILLHHCPIHSVAMIVLGRPLAVMGTRRGRSREAPP